MTLHAAVISLRQSFVLAVVLGVLAIPAFPQHYTQTNLVSNNGVPGTKPDPNLVNAWASRVLLPLPGGSLITELG
jgi:hypothetical protein